MKQKIAIVTGGSLGIGAATVKALCSEGVAVAFTYSKSKSVANDLVIEIEANGGKVLAIHADAADPDSSKLIVNQTIKTFGNIDILVNNVGVFEGVGSLIGDISEESFTNTLDVNVRSVFSLTQETVKHISNGGRIINVSSVLGERGIFPSASVYSMSKAALNGFTRAWAWDLASKEITVNSVIPGPIRTRLGDPNAAHLTALKRLGEPEEVAAVIAFLASSKASFVTGSLIRVDGGVNA